MNSNSLIRATKWSLYDRLATNPYFANIPGFVRIPKSIQDKIKAKQYPTKGVAFLIGEMRLDVPDSGAPGPYFNESSVKVEIIENVQTNANSGLPDCDEVGERAMELFSLAPILDGQITANPAGWRESEDGDFSVRSFLVHLPMAFQPIVLPAMPPVAITPNGAVGGAYPLNVTLALAAPVPGAAIYYTLDGSFPAPLNPTAKLWIPLQPLELSDGRNILLNDGETIMVGGSIQIPNAGVTLKARGYLAGYQPLDASQAFFN